MDPIRWEWYGLVLLTLGQIILVLRAPCAGLPDRLWQAWLVGNPALCLAIVTWRPDTWRRHRAWIVPLLRVITHLVPQQRASGVCAPARPAAALQAGHVQTLAGAASPKCAHQLCLVRCPAVCHGLPAVSRCRRESRD